MWGAEAELGNMSQHEVLEAKEQLAEEYTTQIDELLKDVEMMESGYCHIHQQQCLYSPRQSKELRDAFWIDISGTTCVSWSRVGKKAGLLHKSGLVMFAWLFHRRFLQPDCLLHECTPTFPATLFHRILNSELASQVKCVHARYIDRPLHDGWQVESVVVSPKDLGLPTSRERLYTMVLWQPFVQKRSNLGEFLKRHERECRADLSIYLDSPLQRLAADSLDCPAWGSLSPGDASRLEGYKVRNWGHKQKRAMRFSKSSAPTTPLLF